MLYGVSFPVSEEVLRDDFVLPIGKAKIERAGEHVTISSHSIGTKIALQAAEELEKIGVSAEVSFIKLLLFRLYRSLTCVLFALSTLKLLSNPL